MDNSFIGTSNWLEKLLTYDLACLHLSYILNPALLVSLFCGIILQVEAFSPDAVANDFVDGCQMAAPAINCRMEIAQFLTGRVYKPPLRSRIPKIYARWQTWRAGGDFSTLHLFFSSKYSLLRSVFSLTKVVYLQEKEELDGR